MVISDRKRKVDLYTTNSTIIGAILLAFCDITLILVKYMLT